MPFPSRLEPRAPHPGRISLAIALIALALGTGLAAPADAPDQSPQSPGPRGGVVRLAGRAFCDDDGPFLGLGVSYFQALRHARHDRPRLERNLAFLASRGFNYLRVLSMVAWEGLEIAPVSFTSRAGQTVPGWPDYRDRLTALLDAASRHGLRVELTIFADAQRVMPSREARLSHLDTVLSVIAGREAQLMHLEVANEAWQNGFPGAAGVADLRAFTEHLAARTPVLVAITSNDDVENPGIIALHRGSAAGLATVHFSRDTRTPEGGWLPVRDCWRAAQLPGVPPVTSNEPIGPGASVATETDPIKLCSAALFAHLAGLPGYVFHSAAGVYARESFEATPGIDALRFVRTLLPGDVANWTRNDGLEPAAPFTAYCDGQPDRYWTEVPGATQGCHRNIGAVKNGKFLCLPMGILPQGVILEARRPLQCTVRHPLTGATLTNATLAAGRRLHLPQGPGTWLVSGRE